MILSKTDLQFACNKRQRILQKGIKTQKAGKAKKATSSSKYNYPLTSAIKSVSDKHDSVPWTGSNE